MPHVPFPRAVEITSQNLAEHFPARSTKLKGSRRVALDAEKIFFANIPGHYADIVELHASFPFRVLVNDAAFYAAYPVTKKLGVPGYGIAPAPAPTAKPAGAPPPFFGWRHDQSGGAAQAPCRLGDVESSTRRARPILDDLLAREDLPAYEGSIFQLPSDTVTRIFAAGVAAMDFDGIRWPEITPSSGRCCPRARASPGHCRTWTGSPPRQRSWW